MSVSVRLTRAGAKKAPYYHIIATERRSRRDGDCIEMLGSYDPKKDPPEIKVNLERVDYWVKTGARMSQTVGGLVQRARKAAASTT